MQRFSIPELLYRVGDVDGRENLTLQELDFMAEFMQPNRGYAFGVLPYEMEQHRSLVDSIAKKLNMNKFFRGPRCTQGRRGSICRTLKHDATGCALYRK